MGRAVPSASKMAAVGARKVESLDELLGKAGFKDKPFRSYPEMVEQARKAKKDGVAKYPILWIGGQGFEQLPGTWFSITCNRCSSATAKRAGSTKAIG